MSVLVLGVDPGIAHFGHALVELAADSETVLDMGLVRTAKSDKKQRVRATDDNIRRARELAEALEDIIAGVEEPRRLVAICAEAMSFPRNSGAAAKLALSWGVVAGLAHVAALPILQCTPQEAKKRLCGRSDASKDDVERALRARYGDVCIEGLLGDVTRSTREHPCDALAAVVTCLDSEVIRLARKMAA